MKMNNSDSGNKNNNWEVWSKYILKALDEHKSGLDSISYKVNDIENVLIKQEINLQQHMKRSDSLEKIVHDLEKNKVSPIEKKFSMFEGALKLLGATSLALSIIIGIFKLLQII